MTNLKKATLKAQAQKLQKRIENKEFRGDQLLEAITFVNMVKQLTK